MSFELKPIQKRKLNPDKIMDWILVWILGATAVAVTAGVFMLISEWLIR